MKEDKHDTDIDVGRIEEIKIIDINKDNAEEILNSIFDRIELKREIAVLKNTKEEGVNYEQ